MKKWYQSKTVWFSVLYAVVMAAGLFGYADFSPSSDVAEIVGLIVSMVGVILRLVTDKKIVW